MVISSSLTGLSEDVLIDGSELIETLAFDGRKAASVNDIFRAAIPAALQAPAPGAPSPVEAALRADLLTTASKRVAGSINEVNEAVRAYTPSRFGAVGDVRTGLTGTVASGSTSLISNDAAFTSADVGKSIVVDLAAGVTANLVTTIAAYVSPTQVTLTTAAGRAVTNAKMLVGTDDGAALQAWLDGAAADGAIARIPLGRRFLCLNMPLRYNRVNQVIEQWGDIVFVNGWGGGFAICDKQFGLSVPAMGYSVGFQYIGRGGKLIMSDAASGVTGGRRKGLGVCYTDLASVSNLQYIGTTARDLFAFQPINSRRGITIGSFIDSSANTGQGADGIHFYGSCSDWLVMGLHTFSGDDGSSQTSETADVANTVLERITYVNCSFRNIGHSGAKVYINGLAAGAIVQDIEYHGCDFVTVADTLGNGAPVSIYMDNGALAAGGKMRRIRFFGGRSVILNPRTADGAAYSRRTMSIIDASEVEFHGHTIFSPCNTALYLERADNFKFVNSKIVHTLPPRLRADGLTVASVAWQAGNTVRYTFNADISASGIATGDYLLVTGAPTSENNGGFRITAVAATYVDVTNFKRVNAAGDDAAANAAAQAARSGTQSIVVIDSANFRLSNSEIVGAAGGGGIMLNGSANDASKFVDGALIENLEVRGMAFGSIIFNRNARNVTVKGMRVFDSAVDAMIDETGGPFAVAGGHKYIDNEDFSRTVALPLRKSSAGGISGKRTINRGNLGRRSDSFSGTAMQANGASTFTIDISQLTTDLLSLIDERWLQLGPKAPVSSIVFNTGNGIFTVTTAAAAGAATTWNYSVQQPAL